MCCWASPIPSVILSLVGSLHVPHIYLSIRIVYNMTICNASLQVLSHRQDRHRSPATVIFTRRLRPSSLLWSIIQRNSLYVLELGIPLLSSPARRCPSHAYIMLFSWSKSSRTPSSSWIGELIVVQPCIPPFGEIDRKSAFRQPILVHPLRHSSLTFTILSSASPGLSRYSQPP